LPGPETVQSLVNEAQRRFKSVHDGTNSLVYPALARVRSELFGVCVVGTSGQVYGAGDVDCEFTIMSVSKPFLFALVCETIGPEEARAKLGANATGLPFNSLAAARAEDSAAHHGRPRADRDHPGRTASRLFAGRDSKRSVCCEDVSWKKGRGRREG
jgi:glutaminase